LAEGETTPFEEFEQEGFDTAVGVVRSEKLDVHGKIAWIPRKEEKMDEKKRMFSEEKKMDVLGPDFRTGTSMIPF
jgi:hypothetical protein